jgi:phage/plasmid-like protein (TIGR03299 family)
MSDNVFGKRAVFVKEPAWHTNGFVVPEGTDFDTAIKIAGVADIVVNKYPMYAVVDNQYVLAEQQAIVRMPTTDDPVHRIFGYVGDSYEILQHTALCEKIHKLSEIWPVETIGVLGKGETLFVTLDAGEREVKGDPIRQFFLLTDTKDGKTGISLHFTPVRVVCQNTLILGKASAVASTHMRHTSQISAELDWHIHMVKELQQVSDKVIQQFELMAQATLSDDALKHVLAAAYPFPRKPRKVELAETLETEQFMAMANLMVGLSDSQRAWQGTMEKMTERRKKAEVVYNIFNDEQPDLARTPWAAYNAVVELEDYRESEKREEDPRQSAVFGMRALAKERAYVAAFEEAEAVMLGR